MYSHVDPLLETFWISTRILNEFLSDVNSAGVYNDLTGSLTRVKQVNKCAAASKRLGDVFRRKTTRVFNKLMKNSFC